MIAIRKVTIKKAVFAGVLLCLFGMSAVAQNKSTDSLDNLIRESRSDTQRIRLLGEKAEVYEDLNLDSSIAIGRQALKAAEAIRYKKAIITNRSTLASSFCYKGEYDSARNMLDLALPIAMSINDSISLGSVIGYYGMLFAMQGKYDSANGYFLRSIAIDEAVRDSAKLINAYQNLGTSYQMQSRFSEALRCVQIALKISEARKNVSSQALLLLNLGVVYGGIGDTIRSEQTLVKCIALAREHNTVNVELYASSDLASIYINSHRYTEGYDLASRCKKLAHESGDIGMEATNTSRMATALAYMGRMAEAIPLAMEGISLAKKSRQPLNIFQTNTDFGNLLTLQKKFKEAIPYFEAAFAAMKGSDLFDSQFAGGYKSLSEAYEKTGRYQQALTAFRAATKIQDSIVSKENVRKTTENAMNLDFEKKQQVSRLQREKDEQSAKNRQKILIGGLLFTILLAGVAWYAFSIKKKANVSLENQKATLQTTLAELKDAQAQLIESEKMASLGELTAGIAHEIQNPLNFVNNFSEVSVELFDELKVAVAAGNQEDVTQISADLGGNLEKILHHGKRADAIVKGMLQHSRSSSDQKELTDLNALADEYLRLSYHGLRAKNKSFNATLHTDFDPSLTKTAVVPQDIGRVILNLLTNAFYAVDEKQKKGMTGYLPSVWISTRKTDQMLSISVRDNGDGIPEKIRDKMFQPFFTTKPTGQGTGLGLSLSYDIVKAHGGEIIVESKEADGTKFTIRLPFQPELPKENVGDKI